jgi:plastocyanin
MHAAIVHFAPILGAEKSRTPFYIAGGALVVWALVVSLGVGLRIPSFPRTVAAERAVMAVTAVLVVGTLTAAVATSGGSTSATATATPAGGAATQGAAGPLKQAANPEGKFSFAAKQLTAKAGKVTIDFTNASSLEHNLTIAQGSKVLGATPTFQGATKTLALKLAPGTYTFYCSVPGHRAAGMEGKLTVQ